ncbi:MBL fold metallo-hydrolase [Sphingobacterium sp. KU25419]|nr:MBL fold metallo-hydrolase [Sphingobacterium sp. KU25419]
MKSKIKVLKAFHGDAIIVETIDLNGEPFIMLIDGGPSNSYEFCLRNALEDIKLINVLVLTHIDSDHIGGIIKFVNTLKFSQIQILNYWINCANLITVDSNTNKISYQEANDLEKLLIKNGVRPDQIIKISTSCTPKLPPGLQATILSPRDEELDLLFENWENIEQELLEQYSSRQQISESVKSQIHKGELRKLAELPFKPQKKIQDDIVNSSSIAFILEGIDFKGAFLGDARSEIVEKSLENILLCSDSDKIKLDFIKISHHGSKNNTSNSLLNLIESQKYIISTNGGIGRSRHPDREVIARILHHPLRDYSNQIYLVFNYPILDIEKVAGVFFTLDELLDGNCNFLDNIEDIN